jgi:PKD repeat protein
MVVHEFTNNTTEDVVYTVKLLTTSYYGCTDETEMDITIYSVPTASFTADPEWYRPILRQR